MPWPVCDNGSQGTEQVRVLQPVTAPDWGHPQSVKQCRAKGPRTAAGCRYAAGMSDEVAPIFDDKAQVRGSLDLTGARWQHGDDAGGHAEQVEVAFVPHTDGVTYVAMRNSAQPEGPVLVFTPTEWDAFVKGARDGEFDEPW